MDPALLLLRSAIGLPLLVQGIAKLRREGRAGTAAFFEAEGFLPGRTTAVVAGLTELGAGTLLLAGLGTPLGAAAALGVLVNALAVVRRNGWFAANGGAEYPTVLAALAVGIAATGPGRWSVDHALGITTRGATGAFVAVGLAAVASVPVLARRASVRSRRASQGTRQLIAS